MAVDLAAYGLEQLSSDERLTLVQALWDSLVDEMAKAPITGVERDELDRRLRAHEREPDQVAPWDEVRRSALARSKR